MPRTRCYCQILNRFSKNMKMSGVVEIGSRVVPCGRTHRQTDMTKLIVAFRNYAKAPTNKRSGNGQIPLH